MYKCYTIKLSSAHFRYKGYTFMKNANSVVHFEMPFEDSERISRFYANVFSWKSKQLGPEMGNYVLATTTDSEENGHPKNIGAINGGFYPKKPDMPAQYPSVVIAVEDINASMKKIDSAGGKVLGEPMEIPGVGQYVSFLDTEGNRVSIIQPTNDMKNPS